MIGRIRGQLLEIQPPDILLDVAGVGYEIQVPMTTLYELPAPGTEVSLFTHFVVREDAQLLFGFLNERDRSLFRHLIRVNGVGPKLGLAILSGMDTASFVRAVQREDTSTLVQLPGVGRKTAERLLVEMRDQLAARRLHLSVIFRPRRNPRSWRWGTSPPRPARRWPPPTTAASTAVRI